MLFHLQIIIQELIVYAAVSYIIIQDETFSLSDCFALLLCVSMSDVVSEYIARLEPCDPHTPSIPPVQCQRVLTLRLSTLHLYPLTPPGHTLTCRCSNLQVCSLSVA